MPTHTHSTTHGQMPGSRYSRRLHRESWALGFMVAVSKAPGRACGRRGMCAARTLSRRGPTGGVSIGNEYSIQDLTHDDQRQKRAPHHSITHGQMPGSRYSRPRRLHRESLINLNFFKFFPLPETSLITDISVLQHQEHFSSAASRADIKTNCYVTLPPGPLSWLALSPG